MIRYFLLENFFFHSKTDSLNRFEKIIQRIIFLFFLQYFRDRQLFTQMKPTEKKDQPKPRK